MDWKGSIFNSYFLFFRISLFSGETYLERAALWAQLLFLKTFFLLSSSFLLATIWQTKNWVRNFFSFQLFLSNFSPKYFVVTTCYVLEFSLDALSIYATRINQLIALPKEEKKNKLKNRLLYEKTHISQIHLLMLLLWRHLRMTKGNIYEHRLKSSPHIFSKESLARTENFTLFWRKWKSSSYLSETDYVIQQSNLSDKRTRLIRKHKNISSMCESDFFFIETYGKGFMHFFLNRWHLQRLITFINSKLLLCESFFP